VHIPSGFRSLRANVRMRWQFELEFLARTGDHQKAVKALVDVPQYRRSLVSIGVGLYRRSRQACMRC